MFNPLTTDQLIATLGATMQQAGRGDGSLSAFEREQMLSAYSLSRHLRGELRAAGAFARFAAGAGAVLTGAAGEREAAGDAQWAAKLRAAATATASGEIPRAGEALADLLRELRGCDAAWTPPLAAELRRCLRTLVVDEVAILAEALNRGA